MCAAPSLPQQGGRGSEGEAGDKADGPTSFANLRQMADMPAAGSKQRKRAGATLVSRLQAPSHRAGKAPVGSQPPAGGSAADAAAAAAALLATGGRGA